MANKTDLVIVESPSKAKTIGKYLGPGYEVVASMGHVRDLPKSKLSVDIEHGFTPDYQPIKGKEDVISALKKAAKRSDKVYLATDPDREGEAISWHLKELLNIPDDKTYRVTFNEITKNVVRQSIAAPRAIDQNLVDAQQARRILDRIVGYQLSPLLWKKIRRGLSAGRVQSVATRLVVEREREIRAFQPQEYWTIEADLARVAPNLGSFKAQFHGKDKKMELHSQDEAQAVMDAVSAGEWSVARVKRQEKNRQPAPPFTTSTLQQEASRKLNMSPSRTMAIAQQLYEGVDITGHGAVGLITYMRTDSLRLSDEAVSAAQGFIGQRYGSAYCPAQPRKYKTKGNAQDAHEAIRPSDVTLVPEDIKKDLTSEQFRLYRLIWSRFLACQMANAVYDSLSIDVQNSGYIFRASHSSLKFSGFTAVYEEGKDTDDEEEKTSPLPDLKEGEPLTHKKLTKDQHFTQPPARYSEASLIRALEEQGIGRPSTYAPTISTIMNREYVVKEGGKALRPTPLGEVVTGLMMDKFHDIVDYDFTAQMERQLDKVEEGATDWKALLDNFYKDFDAELKRAEQDLDGERIKVPDEVSEEICPQCGRNLVIKSGRFGRFLACPGWPECDFTMPLVVEMPGKCPVCGGRLFKRTGKSRKTGKQYTYYCCEHHTGKEETNTCDFMTWDVPVKDNCPVCGHTMFKKAGRGARKPFCINEQCSNFTPEEKRGGWRKPADAHRVEAGGALAVDRDAFAAAITDKIKTHPNITVAEGEVTEIPVEGNVIIATGPLTSERLSAEIGKLFPDSKYLNFFDAAAPLVTFDSVDMDSAWFASRYDRGTPDYINCPLTREEYDAFWTELTQAQEAEVHGFEDAGVFEGCMPVEVMARRGRDTLCYGPLKPVGLKDPKTGKEPYAVVQLRKDNAQGSIYNMVGFQTHLKWPEQKRVFSMIPALRNAEYVRYGVMHRNTFLDSPRLLDRYYRVRGRERLMFAGQITGVEGYVESTASGCLAAMELARRLEGRPPLNFSQETAIGALALYISDQSVVNFQPMNVNFGLIPPLGYRVKGKRNKNAELSRRALEALGALDLT